MSTGGAGSNYTETPVSIHQFLTDPNYLGKFLGGVREEWLRELEVVCSPDKRIAEWVVVGRTGCGKTTMAMAALLYRIYSQVLLQDDPAQFYGLLPGSWFVFGILNTTLGQAEVGLDALQQWVDESPWFQQHSPRQKDTRGKIVWADKHVMVHSGSMSGHVLGDNLFGFVLDTANLAHLSKGRVGERTRVADFYRAARRRMVSRFHRDGSTPGLLVYIGYPETSVPSMEDSLGKYKDDPNTHVTTML